MAEAAEDFQSRRAHPRYPLAVAGEAWTVSGGNRAPFHVTSSNISMGGMMLHCAMENGMLLGIGDVLVLGFPHPETGETLSLKAGVVWKRTGILSMLGPCAFGVQFRDTSEAVIRGLHDPAARAWVPPREGG